MNVIKNKIICYLLKHCHIDASSIYTMIRRIGIEEMKVYLESYETYNIYTKERN